MTAERGREALKPAGEAEREAIVAWLELDVGAFFGTHRFEGQFNVGEFRLFAQRDFERWFFDIAAQPQHLHAPPTGPAHAPGTRDEAILDPVARLDQQLHQPRFPAAWTNR